jgi:hypothetical protein
LHLVTCGAGGAVGPAYTGCQFPWCFRVKAADCVWREAWSCEFLCVPGSGTYHQVMKPGNTW